MSYCVRTEVFLQRLPITIEDRLLAEIDAAAEARGYQNRSEIIRDLARAGLQQDAEDAAPSGQCVAALVYVYDHAARDLSKRLGQNFHGHHDLSLAALHVHLDDNSCTEGTGVAGAGAPPRLHVRGGGEGAEGREPRRQASRRARLRRAWRALWPRDDDPDRAGE